MADFRQVQDPEAFRVGGSQVDSFIHERPVLATPHQKGRNRKARACSRPAWLRADGLKGRDVGTIPVHAAIERPGAGQRFSEQRHLGRRQRAKLD